MRWLSIVMFVSLAVPAAVAAQEEQDEPERGPIYGEQEEYGEQEAFGQQEARPPGVSRREVAEEARELSQRTAQLYRTLIREDGYEPLGDRARNLASRAERLRQDVLEGAPYSTTLSEYYDLQEDLHELRERVFRVHREEHSERVAQSWGRVMAAHDRMALALNVPSEALCESQPSSQRPPPQRPPPQPLPQQPPLQQRPQQPQPW